jgi:hypothetical protein
LPNVQRQFDIVEFKDFVRTCQTKLNFAKSDEQCMHSKITLLKTIKPKEIFFSGPYQFVRSTNFLYVPWSSESIKKFGSYSGDGDPTDSEIVNCADYNVKKVLGAISGAGTEDNYDEYQSCKAKIALWESVRPSAK